MNSQIQPQLNYQSLINQGLSKKTSSLQFLPDCLVAISKTKLIEWKGKKIKSSYLIDLVHTLILKYYFKGENRFALYSIVLKERYGYLYNLYIDYLLEIGTIKLVSNYRAGRTSRVYALNPEVFSGQIQRINNTDKTLLKKYKKKIFDSFEFVEGADSSIEKEVREKLISDLFSVTIDAERSLVYLNSLPKSDPNGYNRNVYSVESINNKHIFYHFDNYGRLHTNFTILKTFIRQNCLQIGGEETSELDIKNSQPLFLAKLIKDSGTAWVSESEFALFSQLVCTGKFYDYILQNSNVVKGAVKEVVYKVLFGHNRSNSKADLVFKGLFPTVYHFIKLYKREFGSYKILAHQLQRAESSLIYNKIVKKIMTTRPEIKIITIHDSLIFASKWRSIVESIFQDQLISELDLN